MTRARRLISFALVACCAPCVARSQGKPTPCDLIQQPTTRYHSDSTAAGRVTFIGGGVLIKCPARNITLRGDSAEQYPNRNQMIGNAVYDEPRIHITSNYLTYFSADDHVNAAGNVNAKLPSGSTLVGPVADFYRADPKAKIRTRQLITARARPTITIIQKDSTGKQAPDTTIVVANDVKMDGDSLIYGSGQVVITRSDINATADSAAIDQGKETMRLMRQPQVAGKKDRAFTLRGDLIDMFSHNRKLERVIARANAIAVSDSMTLKSDTIDLRIKDDQLDHAYAWGRTSRATAVSPTQHLLADSINVLMPKQKVQLMYAVGSAFAQGKADTLRFRAEKTDSMDWLRGDTITAHFDTAPPKNPKDTSKTPTIKQLVASGHAKSFYHMAPNDTLIKRPAISYNTARIITINFEKQQVSTITTTDSVVGVYIEPKADTAAKKTNAANGSKTPAKTPPKTPVPSAIPPLPPKRPPQ